MKRLNSILQIGIAALAGWAMFTVFVLFIAVVVKFATWLWLLVW